MVKSSHEVVTFGGGLVASNFDFLESLFPVPVNFGALAQRYCYADPNSCVMKLGMIGETVVNLMF